MIYQARNRRGASRNRDENFSALAVLRGARAGRCWPKKLRGRASHSFLTISKSARVWRKKNCLTHSRGAHAGRVQIAKVAGMCISIPSYHVKVSASLAQKRLFIRSLAADGRGGVRTASRGRASSLGQARSPKEKCRKEVSDNRNFGGELKLLDGV